MITSVILLGKVNKYHYWTPRSVLGPVASMRLRSEVRSMSTYSWNREQGTHYRMQKMSFSE